MKLANAAIMFYDHRNYDSINYKYCNPSKVYDYLSVGLPIISSDNPSMISLIQENKAGVCCNPHDAKKIALTIERLAEDDRYRTDLAINAEKLFTQHTFDIYYEKLRCLL